MKLEPLTEQQARVMIYIRNLMSWGFTYDGYPMFGRAIRALREAAELGLRETAVRLGTSPTKLSRIERGELHPEHVKPQMTPDELRQFLDKHLPPPIATDIDESNGVPVASRGGKKPENG